MRYGEWIGRLALAMIFLLNGFGIVDQSRAAQELTAHGAPGALVPFLMIGGRVLQVVAGGALVVGWHERIAALFLALFLVPATLTAHDFWAYHGGELQGQLVNFLKNLAMFGGLTLVTFRGTPNAGPGPALEPQKEGR
jgi:putative oxidoreductase